MVKQIRYMGEAGSSVAIRRIDSKFVKIYRMLPFTYIGIIRNAFGKLLSTKGDITVLDLGCGDGMMMQNLGLPSNFEITGVDLFNPYLKLAKRKKIYKDLIKKDIRKYRPDRKFNVVFASHVLEHLSKKEGEVLLEKIENITKDIIIIIMPVGFLPQEEYDDDIYQVHKSTWYPRDLRKRGYSVVGQGLKFIFKTDNVVKKYKIFSYLIFLFSMLFQPLLMLKPEWATYIICKKELKNDLEN